MNIKAARLMRVFIELGNNEQREIIDAINDYNRQNYEGKISLRRIINEEAKITGITFGPLNEPCPYCGR